MHDPWIINKWNNSDENFGAVLPQTNIVVHALAVWINNVNNPALFWCGEPEIESDYAARILFYYALRVHKVWVLAEGSVAFWTKHEAFKWQEEVTVWGTYATLMHCLCTGTFYYHTWEV